MHRILHVALCALFMVGLGLSAGVADAAAAKAAKSNKVTFSKRPAAVTTSPTAAFTWKVTPTKVGAQCRLNTAKWKTCKAKLALSKLADGRQSFQVRVPKTGTKITKSTKKWVTATHTWTIDRVAPVGASVSYAGGVTSATSLTAAFTGGADGAKGSGIASQSLQAATAPFAGACGAFGAFTTVATTSPATVALGDGTCVQLRVVAIDRAGNTATSAAGPVVSIERSDLVLAGGVVAVTEGGAGAAPTIALTSAPSAPVTVTATAATSRVSIAPAAHTFTSANWSTPHAFPITAVNDSYAGGTGTYGLTFTASSSDPNWNSEGAAGSVTVIDDEVAAFVRTVAPASPLTLTEGAVPSPARTISLSLATRPRANVVVTATGTQVATAPAALTFTDANWSTPQLFTVTALDDAVAEGTHTGGVALAVSSSDPVYAALGVASVPVTITDNDTSGILFDTTATTTVVEGGAGSSMPVRLRSQPTQTVTLNLASSQPGRVLPSPTSVTFTAATWNVQQVIALQPVPSPGVWHASTSVTISATGSASGESHYHAATASSGGFTAQDADAPTPPGVTITPVAGTAPFSVSEDGVDYVMFDVVLDAPPVDYVDVQFPSPDDQLFTVLPLGGSYIQFHDGNWDEPQRIQVMANQDGLFEGSPHTGTLTFDTSTSDDPEYKLLVPGPSDSILFDIYDA